MARDTEDEWVLGALRLRSRVLLGTALYASPQQMIECVRASGTELATVSLRRVDPSGGAESIYALLSEQGVHVLPNTAGCFTADDAVRTAQLAREALGVSIVKLEVIADDETLLPDTERLLDAAEQLVGDGFTVLPYTNDDPVVAAKLEQLGCAAVMPLAAPIGSGLGIRNPHNLELIRRAVSVPVIVDAGVGTASDVCQAFELGCDAVLLNSAVARAGDPVRMAGAVAAAARAGRDAHRARRMPRQFLGQSASPMEGRPWT